MTKELEREHGGKMPGSADCNGHTQSTEDVEVDEVDKLKAKLISVWNNVKHGWVVKTKTSFNRHSPICLLSKKYNCISKDGTRKPAGGALPEQASVTPSLNVDGDGERRCGTTPPVACADFTAFRRDFATRVWVTYRREFAPLEGSSLTTDTGWGCMLRSGQMLLAQGLMQHLLGRDWQCSEAVRLLESENESQKKTQSPGDSDFLVVATEHAGSHVYSQPASVLLSSDDQKAILAEVAVHRNIIRWFADTPDAPFGIHNLVRLSRSSRKRAGDWYGPAVTAHILKKAIAEVEDKLLHNTVMYVAQDCTVYKGDIMDLCRAEASDGAVGQSHATHPTGPGWDGELIVGGNPSPASNSELGSGWRSVFILIPVRLGGEHFNPVYIACVKGMLEMDSCIGIIGGKPKHSLYFVGYQDDDLIYLDPHYCQPMVDLTQPDFPVDSYHCCPPRKTAFTKMDPSCTLGFYCRTKEDFSAFCCTVTQVLATPSQTSDAHSSRTSGAHSGRTPQQESYPVFSFVEGHSRDYVEDEPRPEQRVRLLHISSKSGSFVKHSSSEDFVLL
ncbi:cysteine protease ATG4D-like [Lampetra fluviatilis]